MIMTLTIMLLQISARNKVQLNQHIIEEASYISIRARYYRAMSKMCSNDD